MKKILVLLLLVGVLVGTSVMAAEAYGDVPSDETELPEDPAPGVVPPPPGDPLPCGGGGGNGGGAPG
ncbi:MAG: hypothetical protein HXS41_13015 [Theionarchaea archaeon]|nr:hypothetical protein [Theionarchaea archaeon]MBU7000210.1 hypothetical protein [Theionarchaea archaeon]MBU7021973.1 hypothetical protein [Theionarchaea archaeon]MBU7035787.1 hypothetical protein [Theionarchaea archaeon]